MELRHLAAFTAVATSHAAGLRKGRLTISLATVAGREVSAPARALLSMARRLADGGPT